MLQFSMCFAKSAYYIGNKIQINHLIDSYNFTSPGENGPAISRFFSANYNLPLFAQNPHLMTELPDNLVVLQNRRKNMLQFRTCFAKSAYYSGKKYKFKKICIFIYIYIAHNI